jgi:hypothetical protein
MNGQTVHAKPRARELCKGPDNVPITLYHILRNPEQYQYNIASNGKSVYNLTTPVLYVIMLCGEKPGKDPLLMDSNVEELYASEQKWIK